RRLPQPDPLAEDRRVDAVAHGVHHPGPVLVRDLEAGRDGVVAPGLPVGRVHPGPRHPDPDLAGTGLRFLHLDQLEDVRVSVAPVDDSLHAAEITRSRPGYGAAGPITVARSDH